MEKCKLRRPRTNFIVLILLVIVGTHKEANAYISPIPSNRRELPPMVLGASRDLLPSSSSSPPSKQLSEDRKYIFSPVSLLLPFALLMAVSMVAWEDYGASNLWPSRHMVDSTTTSSIRTFGARSIKGLGFGERERLALLRQNTAAASSLLPEIRTYNEVSEEHRLERVSRWQSSTSTDPQQQMAASIQDLQQILLDILKLQALVQEYEWDSVHTMIQSSILPRLEPAATVLRQQLSDNSHSISTYNVAYEEIGFDWGSCAWRHCGALADAQEALDELDHLLGVLEPPECLFCLNVAERSIRDMLAICPASYNALAGIPDYVPYQSVHGEYGEETDALDQDYLRMLSELRNTDDVDDE